MAEECSKNPQGRSWQLIGGLRANPLPTASSIANSPLTEQARKEINIKQVKAGVLQIAYAESGPSNGFLVVLLHGFLYDVHSYDVAAEQLSAKGNRGIVPYLRGYGPTRFLSPETPRVGQQAALGSDLLALLDALGIQRATLAGYDWAGAQLA